ncbi:hypothetical protein GCM10017779_41380 [Streptomyces capillispiralis]|nr:hypothetical protein GCM10017779_41380 [Streptomyces capillispiralis]
MPVSPLIGVLLVGDLVPGDAGRAHLGALHRAVLGHAAVGGGDHAESGPVTDDDVAREGPLADVARLVAVARGREAVLVLHHAVGGQHCSKQVIFLAVPERSWSAVLTPGGPLR